MLLQGIPKDDGKLNSSEAMNNIKHKILYLCNIIKEI